MKINRNKLLTVISDALLKRIELKNHLLDSIAKRPKLPLLPDMIADAIIASEKELFILEQ